MKMKFDKKRIALFAAPFALLGAGFLMGDRPANSATLAADSRPPIVSQETLKIANSLSGAFRDVSKHVLPSVVSIENRPDRSKSDSMAQVMPRSRGGANPFKGTPFEDMFPEGFQMNPGPGIPREAPESSGGIGSGVIIDSAGIVLTNNHVVAGGGKVTIRTQDGREFVATEVLTDPQTDIAIVKFKGDSSLIAAKIGNSDEVEVGDWVVALGQPFGLEGTVTAGIVSAKDRGVGITERESFIQTDAAINPGNSGGPLVNLQGEIVGINTAISSRGGGNNGVGFAVPSNLARWVSEQLMSSGHVSRSYLGVGIQPVNYELSTQLGVAPKSGVAVTNVFPDTPAAKAGLKAGDVIVKFGGTSVATPQQLQLAVERSSVGKSQVIHVIRDGKPVELSFSPESAPNGFGTKASPEVKQPSMKSNALGLEVRDMTADVSKQLGMDGVEGVVITGVDENSSAAKSGLEAGMVVLQVNRQVVKSVKEFEKLVQDDTDGSILLLVRSEQGARFVVVTR